MIASITAPDLKTALAKLAELLQKDPDCVVFCGDRYTLLVEQAACRGGGTFSTSVLTFARYLRGYVSGRMLSKQGSVMVIRRLLNEYRGQLVCFGGHVSGGAAAGIYDTITRLSASKVTPEMLEEADCRDNDVLQRKIADIAFLQHKYEEFLAEHGYADESNYFRLLPKIVREGGLRDKHVVLFGFPSFAAQMREGIRACMDCSRRTTAFFIGGEEELYRNEAEAAFCELAEGYEVKRYRLSARENEDAAHLRRGMFRPESFSEPPKKTDAVRLYEAEDMREEAEFIAACIAREVRQGRRYRDAAVLVPSVEEYALTVQTVFREFGIPCFLDRKKSMAEHPLSRFLLSCLEVAADGYAPDSVQELLSNVCFGECDSYRNYLIKYAAYRGGARREIREDTEYNAAQMNYCRERLLSLALPARAEGQAYLKKLREMTEAESVKKAIDRVGRDCGDVSFASYLEQGKEKILRVLEEAETLTGSYYLDARELYDILKSGFAACEVSLIPLKNDAVFVGDLVESKILPVPVLFAAGMSGGVPRMAEDTALLCDKDLEALGALKVQIEPTVAQSNLRAMESAALSLCSFEEKLFCSTTLGEAGKSEMLLYVSALFTQTGATGLPFLRADGEPRALEIEDHCVTRELALRRFLIEKIDCESGSGDGEAIGALYRALAARGERERTDELYQGREKMTHIACGDQLFFRGGTVSPTLLETYFDCPYRNFMSMGLRLKEREEGSVRATDTGNFVHKILEEVASHMQRGEVQDESGCVQLARSLAEQLAQEPPYVYGSDTAGGKAEAEALVGEAAEICRAMYRTVARSEFEITGSEEIIRFSEGGLQLYGKVDRVDEKDGFVRVVDYKTGNTDDSPASYYVGKKLQLQLYLKAVSEGKTPAGAFYFPASLSYGKEEGENCRMKGFFNEAAKLFQDRDAKAGKSELFDKSYGSRDRVLVDSLFRDFVDYASLIAAQGARELRGGFIGASPYKECPSWCKFKGICGTEGDRVRRECSATCADIANAAHAAKEKV